MSKSKYSESQIVATLLEGDLGLTVAEICREHGISNALYYQWKSKYAGVSVNELKRIRDLESGNRRLKKMYAELALENTAIKDFLSRNCNAAARQEAVEVMTTDHQLSKTRACRITGLSRTAVYRPLED